MIAGPRRAADGLALAAAPTFAAMALLTSTGGAPEVLCTISAPSPLGGMTAMYLLMSLFHAAPWLRLTARLGLRPSWRRRGSSH